MTRMRTRGLTALLASALIALAVGCSGTPTHNADVSPPAAANNPPAATAVAQQDPPVQQDPPAQRGDPVGYLQLGHMAPNAPSFDGYFARFGEDGKLVGSGGYGKLAPYMALPPGRYVWSMRPTGSPPSSPLTLTKLVDVKPGGTSTVVLFNTGPQGALRGVVTPEDTSTPPAGMAKLRVLQGAEGPPLSISLGGQPASAIAYGTVTPYQVVAAGPVPVRVSGANMPLTADVEPGSLTTVLVTRTGQGVQLAPVTDTVIASPLAADAPHGVNTGNGGRAATPAFSPMLVDALAGGGALLVLVAAALLLARRRHA